MSKKIRLYIEESIETGRDIELDSDQKNYLINVMRCRDGSEIKIFNQNSGEWYGVISVSKKCSVIPKTKIRDYIPNNEQLVVFCFAPTKKYGEFVVEKATELGVDGIIPIKCERSVVDKINLWKYRKATVEAAEQCGRMDLPRLSQMIDLKDLSKALEENYNTNDISFVVCDLNVEESYNQTKGSKVICIVVGPEGGFGDRDKEIFHKLSSTYLNLGSNVLRAETASIASISIVKLQCKK